MDLTFSRTVQVYCCGDFPMSAWSVEKT